MNALPLLFVAAAIGYLLWTQRGGKDASNSTAVSAVDLLRQPAPGPLEVPTVSASSRDEGAKPNTSKAMDSLRDVQRTLKASGTIDDASAAAIDKLCLDLLHQERKL